MSLSPTAGTEDAHHHNWLFMWMLRVQTQVPTFAGQVPLPTDPIPQTLPGFNSPRFASYCRTWVWGHSGEASHPRLVQSWVGDAGRWQIQPLVDSTLASPPTTQLASAVSTQRP